MELSSGNCALLFPWLFSYPFLDVRRAIGFHLPEQGFRRIRNEKHRPVLPLYETFRYGAVEKPKQRIEISVDVQKSARLCMHAQLRPREDLDNLLDRSESARHGNECIGEVEHHRFSFVHRSDDVQFRQAAVRYFVGKKLRDYTDRGTACFHDGICDFSHQSDLSSPVDEFIVPAD